ncbi:hypothetical protein PENDEC_c003G00397, partial [Penicillium decumbens]
NPSDPRLIFPTKANELAYSDDIDSHRLYTKLEFHHNGDFKLPPRFYALSDELVYMVAKTGYIVACGEVLAQLMGSHRLKQKSKEHMKGRLFHEWSAGSVILHPEVACQVDTSTFRYLNDTQGKLTEDLTDKEKEHAAVRDGISRDHQDLALLVDSEGPQFIHNWKLSTYQANLYGNFDNNPLSLPLRQLETTKFGWRDIRAGRTPSQYAQTMLRLLKNTGTTSTYDQILKIVYTLDASLARDFGEITEDMSMTDFMSKLDFYFENWRRQVDQKRAFTATATRRPQDQRRGTQPPPPKASTSINHSYSAHPRFRLETKHGPKNPNNWTSYQFQSQTPRAQPRPQPDQRQGQYQPYQQPYQPQRRLPQFAQQQGQQRTIANTPYNSTNFSQPTTPATANQWGRQQRSSRPQRAFHANIGSDLPDSHAFEPQADDASHQDDYAQGYMADYEEDLDAPADGRRTTLR